QLILGAVPACPDLLPVAVVAEFGEQGFLHLPVGAAERPHPQAGVFDTRPDRMQEQRARLPAARGPTEKHVELLSLVELALPLGRDVAERAEHVRCRRVQEVKQVRERIHRTPYAAPPWMTRNRSTAAFRPATMPAPVM